MYKLLYKNALGKDKQMVISEEKAKEYKDKKNKRESLFLMGVGIIDYKDIRVMFEDDKPIDPYWENRAEKQKTETKTRFETSPPTVDEWRQIQLGVLVAMSNPILSHIPNSFVGICKSVWNWNSDKTREIIEAGKELQNKGFTTTTFFEKMRMSMDTL
jgi:hypothetical protein